jgi:hypothetical protein
LNKGGGNVSGQILCFLQGKRNKKGGDVPADLRKFLSRVFMKNHIVKGVAVEGMFMILVICIRFVSMLVFIVVINWAVAAYRYNYLFGMMVMGHQVVSQKNGKTQGKNKRYVGSGLQAFL